MQMEEHELEALASKSRRTRRPDYEALAEMLRAATELPCAPSEEAALRQLLADFETWEVRLLLSVCEAVPVVLRDMYKSQTSSGTANSLCRSSLCTL